MIDRSETPTEGDEHLASASGVEAVSTDAASFSSRPVSGEEGTGDDSVTSTSPDEARAAGAVSSHSDAVAAAAEAADHFAPYDLSDGRSQFDWETRYKWRALVWIYLEAAYLLMLLLVAVAAIFFAWRGSLGVWVGVHHDPTIFAKGCYVWFGGLLGGTTFAMKWHYHVVAKGDWNSDRRLWRLFTPLLSAALASAIVALLVSDLIGVLDQSRIRQSAALLAIAYLAGYFSDNTIAALARFARNYLGDVGRERG